MKLKRIMAMVLCVAMVLSTMGTAVFAEDSDESNIVSTSEELAAALLSDEQHIAITLANDIEVPMSSLGTQTPGSGEYKLGGENTESIEIDLNTYKLTITTNYMSAIGAWNDDATITIKNGSMNSTGNSSKTWNINDLMFANCNYEFENVIFDKEVALTNTGKNVTMKNVTINGTGDYYALWIQAEGQDVTIYGLTINTPGRGIKIDEEYTNENVAKVTLDVSNASFTTANKAAIMVKSAKGAEISLSDIDIDGVATDVVNAVWNDADSAAYFDKITVTGGTLVQEDSSEFATTVTSNGNVIGYYKSIQAAVDAAQDGDIITVITDHEIDSSVTVESGIDGDKYAVLVNASGKDITIDLAGHKITANIGTTKVFGIFAADNNGKITLTDSSEDKTGEVNITNNNYLYSVLFVYDETADLVVDGGKYIVNAVKDSLIYAQHNEIITINDGYFSLGNVGTGENGSPWIVNVKGAGDSHVIVNGGTFPTDINRQHWSNEVVVPETHYTVVNEDSTYTVKEGAVAYVKEGMVTGPYYAPKNIGYKTFEEAVEAAVTKNDSPITLLQDVEVTGNVVIGEGISLNCGDYSVVLANETATLTAPEGLDVTTNVAGGKVEYAEGVYKVDTTNYVEWVQAELFAGNDVTLDRDIVISDYDLVHAHPWPSNTNGKYNEAHGNGAIFHIIKPGVVLDLNGHSITWDAHDDDYCNKRQVSLFMVTATGNAGETSDFTVKDSVGTGKVDVYGMASGMYVVLTTAKATIEGGTWTNYPCNTCEASNIFMYPSHGGTLEITGGNFEQKDSEYLLGWMGSTKETTDNGVGVDYDQTKVVISGGTFVGFNPENVKFFDQANSGQETINGCAEGYNVTYDSFKKLYTVAKGWTISAEAEYGEVKAGESVLVTIKASGENFTAADWKLNYEADKFDFAGIVTDIDDKDLHKADKSYISGVVMNADSQDAYNNDTVLAVYKFTAKKLTEEVKGEFTLTDASVGTVAMASSSYPAATPINDEVKILLNDFIVSVKYKAEDVANNKVIIPYDGNAHKIDITTEPKAKVWYSTDEGQTWVEDLPEFSEYGEHKLTYKVDVPDGYDQTAKNPVTIIVNIIEPDKFVEVVEYVSEYKLVLVYTKVDNAYFTYGDRETLMLDVTAAGYQYTDDAGNTSDETYKVYGYVVPREMVDEETAQNDDFYKNKVKFVANATGKPAAVNPYDYNVNCDPSAETIANLADVVYTSGVFNAQDKSMEESYMKAILKADVCREATSLKCVDNDDITAVKNNYTENR